jgi:hypothetical protein
VEIYRRARRAFRVECRFWDEEVFGLSRAIVAPKSTRTSARDGWPLYVLYGVFRGDAFPVRSAEVIDFRAKLAVVVEGLQPCLYFMRLNFHLMCQPTTHLRVFR